jgi:hypothetical protein
MGRGRAACGPLGVLRPARRDPTGPRQMLGRRCFSLPLPYPRGDVDNCHSREPRLHRLPQPSRTERRPAGTSKISLELSTIAVDILVDQRALAASTMLVRRTSIIRAVIAESSKLNSFQDLRWALPLAAGGIDRRSSANGPRDKGIPRTDAPHRRSGD